MIIRRASVADEENINILVQKLDLFVDGFLYQNTIVAEDHEQLVGIAHLRRIDLGCELTHVGVLPEYRGLNLGYILIEELFKDCQAAVYVNTIIPEYFEKIGFVRTNSFPLQYQKPENWCEGCTLERCTSLVKSHI